MVFTIRPLLGSLMGSLAVASLFVGVVGCSHSSELKRVRDLDGIETAAAPPGWEGATLTVDPFGDLRPAQAWSAGYARIQYEHPEHANAYSDTGTMRVGDLQEEYPALLARALPPGARVSLGTAGLTEFIVRGRLLQSTLSYKAHPFLAVPGLIGIPVAHSKIRFRVALELYEGANPDPIWSETYAFADKRFEGLYYGSDGMRELAQDALRDSVGRAAADISVAIATRRLGNASG